MIVIVMQMKFGWRVIVIKSLIEYTSLMWSSFQRK